MIGPARTRIPAGRRAAARAAAVAAALVAAFSLTGCASVWSGWDVAPNGLARDDDRLRDLLRRGRADSALAEIAADRAAPDDELLRRQYEGLAAHYAGDHARSNRALQRAAALAEDRFTRSLSRGALSFLTNDRILPYRPPRTERLLIHYYGILNYLALGDPEEAAVEARRLSHLLDLHEDEGHGLEGPRARLHAALRSVAGAAFEAAGEENDARVAYRLAARGAGAGVVPVAADGSVPRDGADGGAWAERLAAGAAPDSGDVLVIVERGFVPHRVERSLDLLLWPGEIAVLGGLGPRGDDLDDGDRWEGARAVATRLLEGRTGPVFGDSMAGGSGGADDDRRRRPRRGDGGWTDGGRVPDAGGIGPGASSWPRGIGGAGPASGDGGSIEEALAGGRRDRDDDDDDDEEDNDEDGPRLLRAAWPALAGGRVTPLPRDFVPAGPGRAAGRGVADLSAATEAEFRAEEPELLAKALLRAVTKHSVTELIEEGLEEEDEVLGEVAGVVANAGFALMERADVRSWHLLPARLELIRLRLPAGTRELVLTRPPPADAGGPVEPGALDRRPELEVGTVDVRPGALTVVPVRRWH